MDGCGFEPQTSTNACRHVCRYVDQKGLAAMLTSVQSTGVAPEVNVRITQVRKHARDPHWLWNPGQTSPEVQNRGISGPTKRAYGLQKFFEKKKRKIIQYEALFLCEKVFQSHAKWNSLQTVYMTLKLEMSTKHTTKAIWTVINVQKTQYFWHLFCLIVFHPFIYWHPLSIMT